MPRMTIEQLKETPEYKKLTGAQKLFIQTYIANNYDVVNAVRTAHNCKNDKTAKVMSYSILASPNIAAVLTMHFGNDPIDTFVADLRRAIKSKKLTEQQIQGFRLLAEVLGYARSRGNFLEKVKEALNAPVVAPAPAKLDTYELSEYEKKM